VADNRVMRTFRHVMLLAALPLSSCAHLPPPVSDVGAERQAAGARLLAAGDLDQAEAAFLLALEHQPFFPEALSGLGLVALARGQRELGREMFRRAVQCHADFAEGHSNLGVLALEDGATAEAEAEFRAALAIDPGFVRARRGLAFTLLAQDRFEEAALELRKAAVAEPDPNASAGHRRPTGHDLATGVYVGSRSR
jgi:Tfp pilus assembly protein PilF